MTRCPGAGRVGIETRTVVLGRIPRARTLRGRTRRVRPVEGSDYRVRDDGGGSARACSSHSSRPRDRARERGSGSRPSTVSCASRAGTSRWRARSGSGPCSASTCRRARRGEPAHGAPPLVLGSVPRGAETILLVEDEPSVRAVARHLLLACGYHVLEAEDGLDGLRAARAHDGRIDLLVSDEVMPNLGGSAVGRRAEEGAAGRARPVPIGLYR